LTEAEPKTKEVFKAMKMQFPDKILYNDLMDIPFVVENFPEQNK